MYKFMFLVIASLISQLSHADWQLDPARSELTFTTIKKDNVSETHKFTRLAGNVTTAGHARLAIELTSVDTGNVVRDERMENYLFQTNKFAEAYFDADLALDEIFALEEGVSLDFVLNGILSLHGINRPLQTAVSVTREEGDTYMIETTEPITVDGADYGFSEGLKKLAEMAGSISITPTVDVALKLYFQPTVKH